MTYEFKRLGDVSFSETASDNARVLIEEEGEIKRVPKNEIAKSFSNQCMIKLTMENCVMENAGDSMVLLCAENYDKIYEIVKSGGHVAIDALELFVALMAEDEDYIVPPNSLMIINPLAWMFEPSKGLICLCSLLNEMGVIIFSNGSYNAVTPNESDIIDE